MSHKATKTPKPEQLHSKGSFVCCGTVITSYNRTKKQKQNLFQQNTIDFFINELANFISEKEN